VTPPLQVLLATLAAVALALWGAHLRAVKAANKPEAEEVTVAEEEAN